MSLLDRIIARSMRRDRILVSHPASMGRVAAGVAALLALVLAASSTPFWAAPGSPADIAGGLLLAVLSGWAVAASLRVKLGYKHGWLEGRREMIHALAEAQRRGIEPGDWLLSELERDYVVLGLDPALARGDVEGEES